MSVSESDKECPLCMEALDWDDLGFFPCSCGYQICRFCWHRLKTDENGLCPACRQAFPELPVSFNPEISAEELKKQRKRNKERKTNKDPVFKPQDLATLRVVQKNLVFVIGLSSRLTQEDLKKEFAHFGKIIKFVHNKSTAYITYSKPEEAIRAIRTLNASAAQESVVQQLQFQSQLTNGTSIPALTNLSAANNAALNNTNIINAMSVPVPTNRLKASLGTTKYCNHFLRSQQCPKVGECMYLHEIAEAEASFTKEQMQAGKHVEYEKKLMDSYLAKLDWQANLAQQQQQQQQPQQQLQQPQLHHQHQNLQQIQNQNQNQQRNQNQHLNQIQHQVQHQIQQQRSQQPQQQSPQHQQPQHQQINSPLQRPPNSISRQPQVQSPSILDSDSEEDDGLDFDPISVSTRGLRDLLDQQVQQAKQQMQLQSYLQQMSSNQTLPGVLFHNQSASPPSTTTTAPQGNRLIPAGGEASSQFNGLSQSISSLAGFTANGGPQQPVTWQNLTAWTNFLQRSGYGFENSR